MYSHFVASFVLYLYLMTASISRVDVISNSCRDCIVLVDGISESLHAQVHQVVRIVWSSFSCILLATFCIFWCSHLFL